MQRPPRLISALNPMGAAARWAREWPTASQHVARRNAMFATTALMNRRVEREAVNDFLAEYYGTASPMDATGRPIALRG